MALGGTASAVIRAACGVRVLAWHGRRATARGGCGLRLCGNYGGVGATVRACVAWLFTCVDSRSEMVAHTVGHSYQPAQNELLPDYRSRLAA